MTKKFPHLKPAIITSCLDSLTPIAELRDELTDKPLALDVYIFMEPVARKLAEEFQLPPIKTAIEFLNYTTKDMIRKIVENHLLKPADGTPIVAISSFMSEISFDSSNVKAHLIRKAIAAQMEFAFQLGRAQGSTPVIELVVGSVVEHLLPKFNSKGHCEIKRTSQNTGQVRVLNNLLAAYDLFNPEGAGNQERSKVRIALELEPSDSIFLCRDYDSLESIADYLDRPEYKSISEVVGFNLDLSHWIMAGIDQKTFESKELLKSNKKIDDRILHAHISGHSLRGHLGDFALSYLSDEERAVYEDWLSFLNKIFEGQSHNDSKLKFSGYVSLEYELAKDAQSIKHSYGKLLEILDAELA